MMNYKLYDDKLPDDAFKGTELECDYSKENSNTSVGYWKDGKLTIVVHGEPPELESDKEFGEFKESIMRYNYYMAKCREKGKDPLTFFKWREQTPVNRDRDAELKRMIKHIDECIEVYKRLRDS